MNKIHFEEGSGNVFADLELPNPEYRLIKAKLAIEIEKIINKENLSHVQVAKMVHVSPLCISKIINGNLKNYSFEKLIQILKCLGQKVTFEVIVEEE